MWLLDVRTRNLVFFADDRSMVGRYAILSHTWAADELTFQDVLSNSAEDKAGYMKIAFTCWQASRDGFSYAWIDTCCINKNSSSELSEAINAMYRYYYDAAVCYVYLADVEALPRLDDGQLDAANCMRARTLWGCRWFGRGWTLQELIAPKTVHFYDKHWNFMFSRNSDAFQEMMLISERTRIPIALLRDRDLLVTFSFAQRMSWAASRKTLRIEDEAYCLMGLFNVNIPMMYGEGARAFRRLQEQIVRTSTDQSIFAWEPWLVEHKHQLFASSPFAFRKAHDICSHANAAEDQSYDLTNRGLRITMPVCRDECFDDVAVALNCRASKPARYPIVLELTRLSKGSADRGAASHISHCYLVSRGKHWDDYQPSDCRWEDIVIAENQPKETLRMPGPTRRAIGPGVLGGKGVRRTRVQRLIESFSSASEA